MFCDPMDRWIEDFVNERPNRTTKKAFDYTEEDIKARTVENPYGDLSGYSASEKAKIMGKIWSPETLTFGKIPPDGIMVKNDRYTKQ